MIQLIIYLVHNFSSYVSMFAIVSELKNVKGRNVQTDNFHNQPYKVYASSHISVINYICYFLSRQEYLDDHNHDSGCTSFYIQEVWFHKGWAGRAQSPHRSMPTRQSLKINTHNADMKKRDKHTSRCS